MFESTLEAQALHHGDKRLGTLSAAVVAHLGIGLVIVAVTALVVPPVHLPEPSSSVFTIASVIPTGDEAPRPTPPPPKKGTDAAHPGKAIVPTPITDTPPTRTPDSLPATAPEAAPAGPEGPGDGAPGDPDGSEFGVPGGTGDGDGAGGPGGGRDPDPLEVTGDMVRPVLLVKVEPNYPQVARAARLGGRLTLRAVIAEDGHVESVEVVSSTNALFDDAAVDAVRKWRYRPALMNGRPVRVYFSVAVDFVVR